MSAEGRRERKVDEAEADNRAVCTGWDSTLRGFYACVGSVGSVARECWNSLSVLPCRGYFGLEFQPVVWRSLCLSGRLSGLLLPRRFRAMAYTAKLPPHCPRLTLEATSDRLSMRNDKW